LWGSAFGHDGGWRARCFLASSRASKVARACSGDTGVGGSVTDLVSRDGFVGLVAR